MSITLFIIILTVLVSYTTFRNRVAFERMKFNAYEIRQHKTWYRFFSYGLLHADWMHLLINMFVLYSFGSLVENILVQEFAGMGRFFYGLLYVTALFCSVVPSYFKHRKNYYYNAVGASGAVSSVLFASIILHPQGSVYFMFIPVPIPAFIFGVFYLAYSVWMARRSADNVAHDVHFWGAIYGIAFIAALNPGFIVNFVNYVF
ncbi:MAG: rhomboid family intramembrane serine protease [Bacteroidales bacterium]|nr:rhomboid family intramembrane serine protease [Bacteroidales bacterium]